MNLIEWIAAILFVLAFVGLVALLAHDLFGRKR
jgi:hypothetical protein